jgi:hypothetical protein
MDGYVEFIDLIGFIYLFIYLFIYCRLDTLVTALPQLTSIESVSILHETLSWLLHRILQKRLM